MGTISREAIYGGRVRAAKMNADRARKLAVEAAREADRAEADARSLDRLSPRQPSRNVSTGLRLVGGEVPPMRDPGQHFFGCPA